MTLGEKQESFTRDFSAFLVFAIRWAEQHLYTVRLEECFRNPSCSHGHPNSLHRKKLAGHILLFRGGQLITDSSSYRPLGEVWENMNHENRWGGRFSTPDGCHFSRSHEGMA